MSFSYGFLEFLDHQDSDAKNKIDSLNVWNIRLNVERFRLRPCWKKWNLEFFEDLSLKIQLSQY